jgi:hypothetical protein
MSDEDTYHIRWNTAAMALSVEETRLMFAVVTGLGAKLSKDGDQWYFIYGNLPDPDCIVGFGKSPELALRAFYKEWVKEAK